MVRSSGSSRLTQPHRRCQVKREVSSYQDVVTGSLTKTQASIQKYEDSIVDSFPNDVIWFLYSYRSGSESF